MQKQLIFTAILKGIKYALLGNCQIECPHCHQSYLTQFSLSIEGDKQSKVLHCQVYLKELIPLGNTPVETYDEFGTIGEYEDLRR